MPVQMTTTTFPELSTGSVVPTALRGTVPVFGSTSACATPAGTRPATARWRNHRISLDSGWTPEARDGIARLCADAVVGDRVFLSGHEEDVLLAAACLKDHGFCDEEITVDCTSSGTAFTTREHRRITCCHCKETFRESFRVGDDVTCPSCGLSLSVHHHFNRRTCSYLGFTLAEEE